MKLEELLGNRKFWSFIVMASLVLGLYMFVDFDSDPSLTFGQYRKALKVQMEAPVKGLEIGETPVKAEMVDVEDALAANENFQRALQSSQTSGELCAQAFKKYFPKDKWPLPFGPSYVDPNDLMSVLNAGLAFSLAKKDHLIVHSLETTLTGEKAVNTLTAKKILAKFWETETCRGRDYATLFDTILEILRKHKGAKKYRQEDVKAVLGKMWNELVASQKSFYTPTDLTFLLGFWQKAQAQGLTGEGTSGELSSLSEKIIYSIQDEKRLPGSDAIVSAEQVLDFYKEVQSLGLELEVLGKVILDSN